MRKNFICNADAYDKVQKEIISIIHDIQTLNSHTRHNCTPLYTELLRTYGTINCPALCFKAAGEPVMLQNSYGDSLVVLSRSAKSPIKELQKLIKSKNVLHISPSQERLLGTVWCTDYNYGPWYKALLEICESLQIEAPALYIPAVMPPQAANLRGAVFPGGDICFVTDVLVKAQDENNLMFLLKCLIHELRHVWQHTYNNDIFKGYCSYNRILDQESYWKQPSEIDAEAYAYWVLSENGINFILEDLGFEKHMALRTRMKTYEGIEAPKLSIIVNKT